MEPVDQALLQTAGTGQGKTGEHAAVESEGHRGHGGQHGYAENAANPLLDPENASSRQRYGRRRARQLPVRSLLLPRS
jgi:hypothetical protein